MKVLRNHCFLGVFLLLFHHSLAQRGYNYARPSVGRGGPGTANNAAILSTAPASNALRPIVPGLPTGTAATAPGYSTAQTAFGAPSSQNVASGTTAFGGFGGQAQRGGITTGLTNTAAGTGIGSPFGTGASTGLSTRPLATQRTSGSIFGQNTQFTSGGGTGSGTESDYEADGDFSAIPGIPGVNYPIYSQVPATSFDCLQQTLPGYYADIEAQCQVFHICALNRTYSFLCPNGTIFSQETLVCVWWNQYDCASAPTLYANNAFIYDYGSEGAPVNRVNYQRVQDVDGTRAQSNFPIATNIGRTPTATAQPTGLFGNQVGLRPTLTTGGLGGITTPITPAPSYTGRTSGGRFQQTGTTPQTFSNAVNPIGAFSGIGGESTGVLEDGVAIQPNALTTAQLSSSTNREYLPPSQRP